MSELAESLKKGVQPWIIQTSFRARWRDPRFREEARPGIQEFSSGVWHTPWLAALEGRNSKIGQVDNNGILTLQELMITALATADVVAKLLIDKGFITQKEFDLKLFSERASYEALLQQVRGTSVDV